MDYILSWLPFGSLPVSRPPPPEPVTITGIRFPANGSSPHMVSLTTTTDSVADSGAAPWGHIPDFRTFWKTPRAWVWRDFETFRISECHCRRCDAQHPVKESGSDDSTKNGRDGDRDEGDDADDKTSCCVGLYVVIYSFDEESLPTHSNFPEAVFGRPRVFAGDAFVVRLQGNEIGEDLGQDGWAVWRDVSPELLRLSVMAMDAKQVADITTN